MLIDYGIDPFSKEKPKCFPTGAEIDEDVVRDMLSAPLKGNEQFKTFCDEKLIKTFFPI